MRTSIRNAFILSVALFAFSAAAEDYAVVVKDRLDDLVNIASPTATQDGSASCIERYRKLYQDGVLNVAVGFGYWDNSPGEFVYDQFIANGLRRNLVAPCSSGMNVCGFTRTGDVFTKKVQGPDGQLNRFTISLTHGTLSTSNLKNTNELKTQQNTKCAAATKQFFGEVSRGSEVVVYIGHARFGGGPDFCPPVRKPNKHIDYDWYQPNTPGLNRLLSSMETSRAVGKENQIAALYACNSRRHFHQRLASKIPEAGYILTDADIYAGDAIASVATTIDSLMSQKCMKGFAEGHRLSSGVKMFGIFTKQSQ